MPFPPLIKVTKNATSEYAFTYTGYTGIAYEETDITVSHISSVTGRNRTDRIKATDNIDISLTLQDASNKVSTDINAIGYKTNEWMNSE